MQKFNARNHRNHLINQENPNMKLNKYIDHTLLKQDATEEQIDCLPSEASEYDFASVWVNPHLAESC